MRWLLLCLFLCALTPIYNEHPTQDKVDAEFTNGYNQTQSRQFTVFASTPNLGYLRDGEVVIVSSGAYTKLMYRSNQEIYSINVSCVTVRR